MIYSYRNSKKVNNDDIIKINNYSQVLKSCFINSIILNHIGKDYNDFLIYKFIIDDIKYYKPKYLYVISKFNINVDKLLESLDFVRSSLGFRELLDFVSLDKLVDSMSSKVSLNFSGAAGALQFPGASLLLQLCCAHLVDVMAIAQKLDRDGIVNVFIIKIFLGFCRNCYREVKLLSVETLSEWIACGFALLCTFFVYRVSNVMRSAISTRIVKSDSKVESSKVLRDWLFVLLFCADGDIRLLDS